MKREINITEPLWDFIEGLQVNNLFWAVERWLELDYSSHVDKIQFFEAAKETALTSLGLSCYFLNHHHKRELLNSNQLAAISEFVSDNLKTSGGIDSYLDYKKNVHPFNKASLNKLNPKRYWEILKDTHKELAEYALKLLDLPSSSFLKEFTTSNRMGLDFEKYEKSATICCSSMPPM